MLVPLVQSYLNSWCFSFFNCKARKQCLTIILSGINKLVSLKCLQPYVVHSAIINTLYVIQSYFFVCKFPICILTYFYAGVFICFLLIYPLSLMQLVNTFPNRSFAFLPFIFFLFLSPFLLFS